MSQIYKPQKMLNKDIFSIVLKFNKNLGLNINKYFHYNTIKKHMEDLKSEMDKRGANLKYSKSNKAYELILLNCIMNNTIFDGIFIKNFNYEIDNKSNIIMKIELPFLLKIFKEKFNYKFLSNKKNCIKVIHEFPCLFDFGYDLSDVIFILKYDELNDNFILLPSRLSILCFYPFQYFEDILNNPLMNKYIKHYF